MRSAPGARPTTTIAACLVALAVPAWLPSTAPAAVTSQTITASASPTTQSSTDFGGSSLQLSLDAAYSSYSPAAPAQTTAKVHLDNDFTVDTTGLSQCSAATIAGLSTAAAIAACPNSQVGTGTATARLNTSTIPGTLTAFNGTPSGADPTVLFHIDYGSFGKQVATGVIGASSRGGDFGTQINFTSLSPPPGGALTHVGVNFANQVPSPGHHYVSARCNDADTMWNYAGDFGYADNSTLSDEHTQQCTPEDVCLPAASATSALPRAGQCVEEADNLCSAAPADGVTPIEDQKLTCTAKVTPPCIAERSVDPGGGENLTLGESEVWTVIPNPGKPKGSGQQLAPVEVPFPETLTGPPDTASPLLLGRLLVQPGGGCIVTIGDDAQADGDALLLSRPGPHLMLVRSTAVHYDYVSGTLTPTVCPGSLEQTPPAGFEPTDPDANDGMTWQAASLCVSRSPVHFDIVHPPGECTSLDGSGFPEETRYINQYAAGALLTLPESASDGERGGNACGPSSTLMGMGTQKFSAGEDVSVLDALTKVYEETMQKKDPADGENNVYMAGKAISYMKSEGFIGPTTYVNLGIDSAVDAATREARIRASLAKGPAAVSTAFSGNTNKRWGYTGDGHVILLHRVTADGRNVVVSDPAGDYFLDPSAHYSETSCGRQVSYPIDWIVAFTAGRYLVEIPAPTTDPPVLRINDVIRTAPDAPANFWLQDSQGRRTGFIDSQMVNQIPTAEAFADALLGSDPNLEVGNPPDSEALRTIVIPTPPSDLQLHVLPGSGGFRLNAERWDGGNVVAQQEATGAPGGEQIVSIPAIGLGGSTPGGVTSPAATAAPGQTGQRAAALKKCKKIKNPLKRKKCKKKARKLPL